MKIFSSDNLNQDQRRFLIATDVMSLHKIHPAFKNVLFWNIKDYYQVLYRKCLVAQGDCVKTIKWGC